MENFSYPQRLAQIDTEVNRLLNERGQIESIYNHSEQVKAMISTGYMFKEIVLKGRSMTDPLASSQFATTSILSWRHNLPRNFFPTVIEVIPSPATGFSSYWTRAMASTFFMALTEAVEKDIASLRAIRDSPDPIEQPNGSMVTCYNPRCNQLETELRDKIKSLELELYWKDHNIHKLREAMYDANLHRYELKCDCVQCVEAGFYFGRPDEAKECRFRPWLHTCLSQCDLTILTPSIPYLIFHHPSSAPAYVCQIDSDLVNTKGDLVHFTYGSRIYTQALDSPAIQSLNRLFQLLDLKHS